MHLSVNIASTCIFLGTLLGIGVANILGDFQSTYFLLSAFFCAFFFAFLHMRQIYIVTTILYISSILGAFYSCQIQDIQGQSYDTVMQHRDLYSSYVGQVSGVHSRDTFQDTYLMQLISLDDNTVPEDVYHTLRVPKNFVLIPGEIVGYQGVVYPIEDFNGFAYKKYMLSKKIYFSTSTNGIEKISPAPESIRLHLYFLRESLIYRINEIFPGEEAIFLGGILFGARESIPDELKTQFNNSGLTHFIAVSGFNITLCIIFITSLLNFFPVWVRILGVSVSVSAFSLFVGLGAPVVRAALMGVLAYMFTQSGNSVRNSSLLAFVALCMSLYSPLALTYDVSMQLSFLAVIGIIYTQDFFKKAFRWVPQLLAIQEAFVLTLAALSFTLPLMIFQFGQISLLAPLANIAVTWTIPLAMLGGALTVIVDIFSHNLGVMVGFFEWILLHYDILMVQFFGNQEWSVIHVDLGVYTYYIEALYFIILTYFVTLYQVRKNKKQPS